MAHLAETLGIDPITIRLRNCLHDNDLLATQSPVPGGVSVAELLEICAREAGAVETATGWQLPDVGQVGNLPLLQETRAGPGDKHEERRLQFRVPGGQHGAGSAVR